MKLITLVSGGIDSTVMSVLAKEQGFELLPLFVNYGQLSYKLEWKACMANHKKHGLPQPKKIDVPGFGHFIKSGLTNSKLKVKEDAFLPGRNLFFLLVAASYAYQNVCRNIAIGLLNDRFKIFPDQSKNFISRTEKFLSRQMEYEIKILTPLMKFNKSEVIKLAEKRKINNTYSCHNGKVTPCGKCISCIEINIALGKLKSN